MNSSLFMNGENKHLFSIKLSYRCVFTCCRPPRSSPLPPSYFILAPIGANLSFSRLEWKQTLFFSLPYIFTEIACEKFNLHYIKHKNIAFAKSHLPAAYCNLLIWPFWYWIISCQNLFWQSDIFAISRKL